MWRRDAERRLYHKRRALGGDRTPAVDVDAFRSTFDSCYLWEITIEFVIVTSSLSFLGLFCRPFRMFEYVILCRRALECIISELCDSNLVNCREARARDLKCSGDMRKKFGWKNTR